MRSFVSLGLFACFISLVSAAISCNSSNHCPEDSPCCSQYGTCGTGSYCLGGCDIRYSYNLSACMPMPRMSSIKDSFASIDDIENQSEYLGNSSEATWVYTGYIDSHDDALLLQMPNGSTGTVVSSTEYFLFGKVGATMKSSRDRGVITAFITFSDVQDEIDYEFVGYNLTNPQTNYYAKGILNYTNSRNSSVSNTFSDWHYYEIDWQEERIVWSIDGNEVRTLERDDTYNATTDRYDYPQTPARLQFSLWPGGSSLNGLGTIEWAGGAINWDSQDIQDFGYYYAYVKNVTVIPHDLPDSVQKSGNSSLNAFLYNSTAGNLENVYLTNKKTWLGSGDATGFDPENEDDDLLETTEIVSSSASSAVTKTSVKTKSASTTSVNVPGQDATNGGTTDEGTTASYTGGFVQNSKKTSSGSSSSGSSSPSSSSSGAYRSQVESIVAVFVALGAAMFTFGL